MLRLQGSRAARSSAAAMRGTEGCWLEDMPAVLSVPIMRAACSAEAAMQAAGTRTDCRQGSTGDTPGAQEDNSNVNTTCHYRRTCACMHACTRKLQEPGQTAGSAAQKTHQVCRKATTGSTPDVSTDARAHASMRAQAAGTRTGCRRSSTCHAMCRTHSRCTREEPSCVLRHNSQVHGC